MTVMLTTGRTVAAEQLVLASIDAAGTRSITIRAEDGAGLTSDVIERIGGVEGIEWSAAFSSAVDATNTLIPDGTHVPVRYAYGTNLDRLGIPRHIPLPDGVAYASSAALDQLGLPEGAGSVTLTTGTGFAIAGAISTPDFLKAFEPVVLIPRASPTGTETVNILVVIATRPELVAPVSEVVLSLLSADDPTKVTVQTSESLAQLREIVQGQLGSFSRGLVLIVLGITGTLVAIMLYGLVMLRRKDFGRRRALGATRSFIIGLLLTQTGLLAAIGAAIGSIAGVSTLLAMGDPVPGPSFLVATCILAVTTAIAAAFLPAFVASRRDPITELRVP